LHFVAHSLMGPHIKLHPIVAVLAVLSATPIHGGISDEWTTEMTTSVLSEWRTWMEATPTILPAFEVANITMIKTAHEKAVWYASNCLSLCHLGVDNFCSATQTCIMSGVFSGQDASSCDSVTCLSSKMCGVSASTIETCKSYAKTWSSLFKAVADNQATLGTTVTEKALMFAHGLLGCFRTTLGSSTALSGYIGDLDSYLNDTVNLTDSTTGLSEVYEKLKEQTLVFEWVSAFLAARCDTATATALADASKTAVCQAYAGSASGMTNDADADEKFCFFPPSGTAVSGCTSTTNSISDLSTSFAAMLDDGHGCVEGGVCCSAVAAGEPATGAPTTGTPTTGTPMAALSSSSGGGSSSGAGSSGGSSGGGSSGGGSGSVQVAADLDVDLGILDLADHPMISELQFGGGAYC